MEGSHTFYNFRDPLPLIGWKIPGKVIEHCHIDIDALISSCCNLNRFYVHYWVAVSKNSVGFVLDLLKIYMF